MIDLSGLVETLMVDGEVFLYDDEGVSLGVAGVEIRVGVGIFFGLDGDIDSGAWFGTGGCF